MCLSTSIRVAQACYPGNRRGLTRENAMTPRGPGLDLTCPPFGHILSVKVNDKSGLDSRNVEMASAF